ncbi:hypothetical protein CDD80_3646 [Ophiocordyceps camponoti-rufipedis]|uniref:Methyltransferase type 11 domain-containing protein n=1 Tax=Ophiocordyceps camponoti-rufipedis TaxID=2004952 RepID=A0A2C5Z2S8_9HYPO|nr:hypothetical protein CDD80_3646 [Ophiocordyceps camponoti-rufipedis]
MGYGLPSSPADGLRLRRPADRTGPRRPTTYGREATPGQPSNRPSGIPHPLPRESVVNKSRSPAAWPPSHIRSTSPSPSCDAGRRAASRSKSSRCSTSPTPSQLKPGPAKDAALMEAVERGEARHQLPVIYPELDRYRDLQRSADRRNVDLPHRYDGPPRTPSSVFFSGNSSQVSASPSTRLSVSPGPGPYSRDTTPTSISSQSPVLVSSTRFKDHDPPAVDRPPLSRMRAEAKDLGADPNGLASVRESMNSSSSGSTVRAGDRNPKREKRSESRLSSLPPSPPGRKSSQKLPKSRFYSSAPREPTSTVRSPPRPEPTRPSLSPRTGPPRRPSRDGTQDIPPQSTEPVSVIQSKLSSIPRSFERQASEPTLFRPRLGSTTSLPQIGRHTSTPQLPGLRSKAESARSAPAEPKKPRPRQSSSPKAATSFTTRFPFFTRKKAVPEAVENESSQQKKASRKGPVAGTGHEGYGRIGAARRRSSSSGNSNAGKAAIDAQATRSSPGSRDSFFADRVRPVVIAGGEVVENRNTPSSPESGKVSPQRRSSSHSGVSSGRAALSRKSSRITRWPTIAPSDSHVFSSQESKTGDERALKPSLAFRRSIQRLRSSPDNPIRLPKPILTDVPVPASPPLTSVDASITSDESQSHLGHELSRGSNDSCPAASRPQKRGRLPRKWNLFGRSHSRLNMKDDGEEVQAAVVAVDRKRVAYYAMMDSAEHDEGKLGCSSLTPEDKPGDCVWNVSRDQPRVVPGTASKEMESSTSRPAVSVASGSSRPSRLPQVGRIPKVVPSHQDRACPLAFSRPFRHSGQALPSTGSSVYDPESIATGPTPPRPSTPTPDAALDEPADSDIFHECVVKLSPEVVRAKREFLTMSPQQRIDEDSSSCGSKGARPFADATAIIPKPNDPLDEDEIWDEYNDLLDEGAARRFLTSVVPADEAHRTQLKRSRCSQDHPTGAADGRRTLTLSNASGHLASGSVDVTERIRRAFLPHPHSSASTGLVERFENRLSSASDRTMFTDCSAISEDESPWAQVNLRVGSMTVSKWLTFGQVLFSDLRHELDVADEEDERVSILVVDGLGNDDWSFYAAETYPAASFYNLSPRAALSAEMRKSPSSFPLSPANHHQVQYMSHLDKFPFPSQRFHCVVYRFPVAAPESHYRNIINEARRVLRPGGFIELSVLDADLNSMGNRARRTVRCLKERIHRESADVNLSSAADLVLRLLGKAGFSNIRVARVGVPVASSISSADVSTAAAAAPSLADMMRDNSPMADESITRLVTRVGRWWYTRCYEQAGGPSEGSIWMSKELLSECEELGTSLKLMVCCARAPGRAPSL